MPMAPDMFPYRFAGHCVSNGPDKIPIFPKFSAPHFSLYLRISQKDLFRTNAFENSHHQSNRIFEWDTKVTLSPPCLCTGYPGLVFHERENLWPWEERTLTNTSSVATVCYAHQSVRRVPKERRSLQ